VTFARKAARVFPAGRGWFFTRCQTSTATLVTNAGYASSPPKLAADAANADSASPIRGKRAINSAEASSTASAISR
jgi:hypothetical protein